MKILKSVFTLVMLMSLTFVSCSKSDDDTTTSNTAIVGKWISEKTETLDVNGNVVETYITTFHPCGVDYLEAFADGNFLDVYYGRENNVCYEGVFKSMYRISNDNITFVYEDGQSETLKFKITENTFVLTAVVSKEEAEEYSSDVVERRMTYIKQ